MVVHLRELGHVVNRKRVQRLMRTLGLAGMAPGPATSCSELQSSDGGTAIIAISRPH
jgi:hypothetical protein